MLQSRLVDIVDYDDEVWEVGVRECPMSFDGIDAGDDDDDDDGMETTMIHRPTSIPQSPAPTFCDHRDIVVTPIIVSPIIPSYPTPPLAIGQ